MRTDARQYFRSPDRLCNIVDATNLERFHLVLFGFERTEKDDGYGTSRLIGLKTSTYLVTVHARHPDIQQNQRRRLNLRAAEGQFPIGRQPHPVTLFPQYFLQQSKVGRFIVDHENLIHVSIAGAHEAFPSGNGPGITRNPSSRGSSAVPISGALSQPPPRASV